MAQRRMTSCLARLRLKNAYTSYADDLVEDFFIPALSRSYRYDRISGFFSSYFLPRVFRGIRAFVQNDGKMRVLVGYLPPQDATVINRPVEDLLTEYIPEAFTEHLLASDTLAQKDHLRLLAWLIANKRATFRLAIPVSEDGKLLPLDQIEPLGLFHEKVGILQDRDGHAIAFSGSTNETVGGWITNREEFKVFRGWVRDQESYFLTDTRKFERYWRGHDPNLRVIRFPDPAWEHLRTITPPGRGEIDFRTIERFYRAIDESRRKIVGRKAKQGAAHVQRPGDIRGRRNTLRQGPELERLRHANLGERWPEGPPAWGFPPLKPHQVRAVEEWERAGRRGILEMATGTGKTLTGIACAFSTTRMVGGLMVLILAPNTSIVEQWGRVLRPMTPNVVTVSSSHSHWPANLENTVRAIENGTIPLAFVVSTNQSFQRPRFLTILRSIDQARFMLIADEAHWIGAEGLSEVVSSLEPRPKFTLGLTATPMRYFDPAGSEELRRHLGPVLERARVTLAEAIRLHLLCPYRYHPILCSMTVPELARYAQLTRRMLAASGRDDADAFERVAELRAEIVKHASQKPIAFKQLIRELKMASEDLRFTLVYCEGSQLGEVRSILSGEGIATGDYLESTTPEQRERILDKFRKGGIDMLLSIHCLDEGIDIPGLRRGIVLSSSGNPKEFVQRRGRLLRTSEGKPFVDIFDLVVVPPPADVPPQLEAAQLSVVRRELDRMREFNAIAMNKYLNHEFLAKLDRLG